MLKANAELVANARTSKRTKKQISTKSRCLFKRTIEELRAQAAVKEAQKKAQKTQALEKRTVIATKKTKQQRNKALRQLARAAVEEEKKRLSSRSRIKCNYLLWIEEDVFE